MKTEFSDWVVESGGTVAGRIRISGEFCGGRFPIVISVEYFFETGLGRLRSPWLLFESMRITDHAFEMSRTFLVCCANMLSRDPITNSIASNSMRRVRCMITSYSVES